MCPVAPKPSVDPLAKNTAGFGRDLQAAIFDLDGTVYLGEKEVPGAARFIADLARRGIRPLFLTNRSNRSEATVAQHLRGYGIACAEEDILTSARAAAAYLQTVRGLYVIGEEPLLAALNAAHIPLMACRPDLDRAAHIDTVLVSFDRSFDYAKLVTACRLIDRGARFVATNPDGCLRTHEGLYPGTGAIVAAVAAGCGQTPEMIGKPERAIVDMAVARLGCAPRHTLMIGDNLQTDIPAGAAAGLPTALMLTGVCRRSDLAAAPVQPDLVAESYAHLQQLLFP